MRIRMNQAKKPVKQMKRESGKEGIGQLVQLIVCLVLFFTVFIGKGAFPERIAQVGPQLLGVIQNRVDFRGAFAALGSTITEGEPLAEGVEQFCITVFGLQRENQGEDTPVPVFQPEFVEEAEPVIEPQVEPETPNYQVGDVLETVAVSGQALPEAYSGDHIFLGDMEMVTPAQGRLTSPFGYRNHPTLGTYSMHGGVDIGAASGSEVRAFADATVERVGEHDDFGRFVQLRHENDVTTFYAHCKSVEVKKGEQVQAGQTVARVGSTGKSTGAHLHFEVRLGHVRLDPMHYITLQEG